MDIASPYESSELMSSEFFDSVFSLEQEGLISGGLNGNFDDDMFLSSSEISSHADEVNSTNSLSSTDCDKWSTTESITESPVNSLNVPESDLLLSLITSQSQTKVEPQVEKKPTRLIINNGSTKRIIVPKQHTVIKKSTKPKQQHIFRVQTENGRSLLLPLNISNVKSIKIVNSNNLKEQDVAPLVAQDLFTFSHSKIKTEDEELNVSSKGTHYPPLDLTAEEKRLLAKDGIQLPTHYPLTKNEERELKRIRRKIRNKISAQDSRKRKKEYVDGLEERVKRGSEENKFLLRRVKQLQKQNSRLMEQMSKLQALIFNSGSSKAAPTTCLMIVLFSALLVSLPNLNISNNKEIGDQQQVASLRRSLLFSKHATNEEDSLNMEEFVRFGKNREESDLENSTGVSGDALELEMSAADKEAGLIKLLQDIRKEYNIPADKIDCFNVNNGFEMLTEYCNKYEYDINNILGNIKDFFENEVKMYNEKEIVNSKIDYGGTLNEKGFIEPDIDDFLDDTPVSKKSKLDIDNLNEVVINTNKFTINSSKKE